MIVKVPEIDPVVDGGMDESRAMTAYPDKQCDGIMMLPWK